MVGCEYKGQFEKTTIRTISAKGQKDSPRGWGTYELDRHLSLLEIPRGRVTGRGWASTSVKVPLSHRAHYNPLLIIHSFTQHVLNTYYLTPSLDTGDSTVNKTNTKH